jgi:transcription termination/antitermination protein NusG
MDMSAPLDNSGAITPADLPPVAGSQYPWFVLMVKSHHEKAVANALRNKGYSEFLPLYEACHCTGGRIRTARLPLFPTYVFCRFDPLHRLPILITPGVFAILGTGNTPAPVDESEIGAIQTIVACGSNVAPWPYLNTGDTVQIEEGPLKGLQGILLSCKGNQRLLVSVTLLQRAVAVELDREWVRPVASLPVVDREWKPAGERHLPCGELRSVVPGLMNSRE